MSDQLIVSFPWNFRKRNVTPKVKSKSTLYRENECQNNPQHYNAMLEADRKRKKAKYKSVKDMSEDEAEEQRKKWQKSKKSQRLVKQKKVQHEMNTDKPTQDVEVCPPRKKLKDMNAEERREYNRNKKEESRARRSKQKKSYDRQKDLARKKVATECNDSEANKQIARKGGSRSSLFRKAKKIREELTTQTPKSAAAIIDKVVTSCSPRKVAELEKRGVKRKLDDSLLAVTSSIQEEIGDIRKKKMTEGGRQHYRMLVNAACRATRKYPKARGKVAALLKIGGKVRRKKEIKRKTRKDALPEATKECVRNFWKSDSVSREVPLKKRVKKGQPPFLLECSYTQAYQRFRASHPSTKIGYVKFVELKPRNVMLMKALERIVCCCIKCENVKLKMKALNQLSITLKVPEVRVQNVDDLAAKTTCSEVTMKCLKGDCTKCDVKALDQHYQPLVEEHRRNHDTTEVKFDEWKNTKQDITVNTKEGGTEKRTVKRLKRVTSYVNDVEKLTDLLKEDMKLYPAHKFRADWQKAQFDQLKTNMPPKSAIVVIDFAMNYTCFLQDEVQSYHWSPPQVTIHPCYAYINMSDEVSPPTHTEAINIISSDPRHDADAVAKFLSICSAHLKQCYSGITHMFQFSDCCASQYRCSTSFADLSFSQDDIGLKVQRHYFESSHGKSPADGQGAVIKRAATIAVTRREAQIRSAEEFYQFCQEKLTDVGQGIYPSRQREYQDAKRSFMFVKSEDINRRRPERKVKTVTGSMAIHCVKASGSKYNIQTRDLSCFCNHCLYGDGDSECINISTVGSWTNVQLIPKLVQGRDSSDALHEVCDDNAADSDGAESDAGSAYSLEAEQTSLDIALNSWVAVIYDGRWWPGVVEGIAGGESPEYQIKFMKSSSSCTQNRFYWPTDDEIDSLPSNEILTVISGPPTPITNRHYSFSDEVYQAVQEVFESVV